MKKSILFVASIVMLFMFSANAQNKAFKIVSSEEEPVFAITHVEECPTTAVYRGDEGHDPDSARIIGLGGPWTVEVWVKPEVLGMNYLLLSGGNTQFRLQHFTEHPGDWWGCIDYNAVGIGVLWNYGPEYDDIFGDPGYIAEVDEWQHFAIIHDEWTIRLIVNGVDEYYLAICHNLDEDYTAYDALAWGIGDNETGWMPTPSCEIDNYRVWDKARTNEDVLADFKKVVPADTDGLVANYTFDDDPEGRVINTAGTDRHMEIWEESAFAVSYVASGAPLDPSGIFEQNVVTVSIHPNPASGHVFVDGTFSDDASAEIRDITGRVIMETPINNNRIDLPQLKQGIYFVQIADNSKIYTGKVLIK